MIVPYRLQSYSSYAVGSEKSNSSMSVYSKPRRPCASAYARTARPNWPLQPVTSVRFGSIGFASLSIG